MDFSYYGAPARPYQHHYLAMSPTTFPHTAMDQEASATGVSPLWIPSIAYHLSIHCPAPPAHPMPCSLNALPCLTGLHLHLHLLLLGRD
jgi:hypothetical protein